MMIPRVMAALWSDIRWERDDRLARRTERVDPERYPVGGVLRVDDRVFARGGRQLL